MSRNRCIEICDEQGKPIGHARVRSDASPQTIEAIEELARICVAALPIAADPEGEARLKRIQARFAERMAAHAEAKA